ncbi:OsmC family protein [Salinisphaera hydrothermalis]|uniref:OsmC-like protein n=1 Tax=Salinisphaera hydrothermalis (strain C41B8) TaxID=1304275 RepID=A0A084IHX0_SALHC|nr:OsmC family protein [Salinisphaera hydrothermalis]KEZ76304.1 OsmC-like protein [Salinisphaera hydrothermalis C41B8]
MQSLPHHYTVHAHGTAEGEVHLDAAHLPELVTTPPPEFDGPEGYWSPETLLVASVASCFVLTFRAVARASKLEWDSLTCDVEAVLERHDGRNHFSRVVVKPHLLIHEAARERLAEQCLDKAEDGCLVTNSLTADVRLEPTVEVVENA